MAAYYNENDGYAAAWLRELIARGCLPMGEVDERSIVDVRGVDIVGFDQCHFFAGIGGWPYALALAGWEGPVWTGSCPCQPFSAAGKRKGAADERHLWPEFYRLIAERRPSVVFGEQVASKDGREWLAGVRTDLEALGYAVGAADLCAASAGAPHIRQRLYWVADANGGNASAERLQRSGQHRQFPQDSRGSEGLVHSASQGRHPARRSIGAVDGEGQTQSGGPSGDVARTGNAALTRLQGEWCEYRPSGERHSGLVGLAVQVGVPEWNGPTVAVECSDGARRVSAQPDSFPLAHGVPARVGRLRAYGNAIVPQVAAEFISAFMET